MFAQFFFIFDTLFKIQRYKFYFLLNCSKQVLILFYCKFYLFELRSEVECLDKHKLL